MTALEFLQEPSVREPLVNLILLLFAMILIGIFHFLTARKEAEMEEEIEKEGWSLSSMKKLTVYRWKLIGLYLVMFSPLLVAFLVSE